MSAATILTLANGKGIDLLDPKPEDIDFNVIAEHLAKEKRFNGATPGAEYSVAEHCCRGADAIMKATGDSTLAAYFLLHDAHEATLKDLTTPLKAAVAEIARAYYEAVPADIINSFDILEHRADASILDAAGLQWPIPKELRTQVKHWDIAMFVTEWRDLMRDIEHPNWGPYKDIAPLPERILLPWPWEVARKQYLARCMKLLPSMRDKLAVKEFEPIAPGGPAPAILASKQGA